MAHSSTIWGDCKECGARTSFQNQFHLNHSERGLRRCCVKCYRDRDNGCSSRTEDDVDPDAFTDDGRHDRFTKSRIGQW